MGRTHRLALTVGLVLLIAAGPTVAGSEDGSGGEAREPDRGPSFEMPEREREAAEGPVPAEPGEPFEDHDLPSDPLEVEGGSGLPAPLATAEGPACGDRTPHPPVDIAEDPTVARDPITGEPVYRPGSGVVAGNGTAENPYVIEGWCIVTSEFDVGIDVSGVDFHFVLRNNLVSLPVLDTTGIRLEEAPNVTVRHSEIVNNDVAIEVGTGSAVTVANNTMEDNDEAAVLALDGGEANVTGNQLDDNGPYWGDLGVGVGPGSHATLEDNEIDGSYVGVWVVGGTATVAGTNLTGGEWGIIVENGQVDVRESEVFGDESGILVKETSDLHAANSTIASEEYAVETYYTSPDATIGLEDNNISGYHGGVGVSDANLTLARSTVTSQYNDVLLYWEDVNATLVDNNLAGDEADSVDLHGVEDLTLRGNTMARGLEVTGYSLSHFDHDVGPDNTVQGDPLRYLEGAEDTVVDGDAGQVFVVNSTNVSIQDQEMSGTPMGIQAAFSEEVDVADSEVINASYAGVHLVGIENATVQRNNLTNNTDGIEIGASDGVEIHANNLVENGDGVENFGPLVDARGNWWGCPEGPQHEACDPVRGQVQTSLALPGPWEETFPPVLVAMDHLCRDMNCTFVASAFSFDGIDRYEWDFGDGNTSVGSEVNHTYEREGDYTVELTVTDGDGDTNTTTGEVGVPAVVIFEDSFDDGFIDPLRWPDTQNMAVDDGCGSADGTPALRGASGQSRHAATRELPVATGGSLSFALTIGGSLDRNLCEEADGGEGIKLQYRTPVEPWTTFAEYDTSDPRFGDTWTTVEVAIPGEAQTDATQFRWRQPSASGSSYDHWALDEVLVRADAGSATPPSSPDNLTAEGAPGRVDLDWEAPAWENVDGYVVHRSPATCDGNMTHVANVSEPTTSLTDEDVEVGQGYCYSVEAVGPGGSSAPANATATAHLLPDPGIADVDVEKNHLRTAYTPPALNPVARQDVTVEVTNDGDHATEADGHEGSDGSASVAVDVFACPRESSLPGAEPAKAELGLDRCDHADHVHVAPLETGAERTVEASWIPRGDVGGYEIVAVLDYQRPQQSAGDDGGSSGTFVVAAGTGLGGVNAGV